MSGYRDPVSVFSDPDLPMLRRKRLLKGGSAIEQEPVHELVTSLVIIGTRQSLPSPINSFSERCCVLGLVCVRHIEAVEQLAHHQILIPRVLVSKFGDPGMSLVDEPRRIEGHKRMAAGEGWQPEAFA